MQLGAFSISLSVKDIHQSKDFYEKLGFTVFAGHIEQRWLIMKNDKTLIGLFQGMFEGNMLTFNPGWDENAQALPAYDDVRSIQQQLQQQGIELAATTEPDEKGPAHIVVKDPDGNTILIDQHAA
ncbi:MAG TPA: glyoxalase [Chitinophagaceae bacterium]|nr:glyoxalase [Chitinophagaceae bacterium]HCT24545.1 glyoxalase [Chitinophagaceae bacterium]